MKVRMTKVEAGRKHHLPTLEYLFTTEGGNQALAGAIPYCGEYPGPRFEDKFRSANQMDGISKAGEI